MQVGPGPGAERGAENLKRAEATRSGEDIQGDVLLLRRAPDAVRRERDQDRYASNRGQGGPSLCGEQTRRRAASATALVCARIELYGL